MRLAQGWAGGARRSGGHVGDLAWVDLVDDPGVQQPLRGEARRLQSRPVAVGLPVVDDGLALADVQVNDLGGVAVGVGLLLGGAAHTRAPVIRTIPVGVGEMRSPRSFARSSLWSLLKRRERSSSSSIGLRW